MPETLKLVFSAALFGFAAAAAAEVFDDFDAMSLAQGKLGPANTYWIGATAVSLV